jgi:hypothetical protein
MYWMDVSGATFYASAALIKDRVLDFVQVWGDVIGLALSTVPPAPGPGGAVVAPPWNAQKVSLNQFFHSSLGTYRLPGGVISHYTQKRNQILTHRIGVVGAFLLNSVIMHHRIGDIEQVFQAVFGNAPAGIVMPYWKRVMYHHLVFVTIPRIQCYALDCFANPAEWTPWTQALASTMHFLH